MSVPERPDLSKYYRDPANLSGGLNSGQELGLTAGRTRVPGTRIGTGVGGFKELPVFPDVAKGKYKWPTETEERNRWAKMEDVTPPGLPAGERHFQIDSTGRGERIRTYLEIHEPKTPNPKSLPVAIERKFLLGEHGEQTEIGFKHWNGAFHISPYEGDQADASSVPTHYTICHTQEVSLLDKLIRETKLPIFERATSLPLNPAFE